MLSLRENKIKNLPNEIGCLVNLDILDISHNHLEHLPEQIGMCKNLSALDLQHNELLDIPETIGNLVNLSRLGLRYNRLTVIPQSLKNCVNMEEFNIEGNSVSELNGILPSLTLLRSITLSRNSFSSFPSGGKGAFIWIFNLKINFISSIIHHRFVCRSWNLSRQYNKLEFRAQPNWQNTVWNFYSRNLTNKTQHEGKFTREYFLLSRIFHNLKSMFHIFSLNYHSTSDNGLTWSNLI